MKTNTSYSDSLSMNCDWLNHCRKSASGNPSALFSLLPGINVHTCIGHNVLALQIKSNLIEICNKHILFFFK